ncbi:MAG TPA: DUF4369 domain-containing protein, partial [Hanamia sp.]|nr:DUF4369 domain-containing protein [Hanamia sp.]
MKIIFTLPLLLLAFSFSYAQGFKATLEAPDYKSGLAYLTYYYGKNMNIEDSAIVNSKGIAIFQKKEKIPPGVYSIVFPGKNKFYDFLIDKGQNITIKADTTDLINKTIVTGSKENILFQQYQKFAAAKGALMQKELEAFKSSPSKNDSALHEKKYSELNGELNNFRDDIIAKNPASMLAALLT